MLEFDEPRTQDRISQLETYYDNELLTNDSFICSTYSSCKSSVKSYNFYQGQLSHVGSRYDVYKDSKELRVVITGISYGHPPAKVDMTSRCRMVVNHSGMRCRYYSDGTHHGRNPHMRGTTLLLKRILLGEESLNDYHDWEAEFPEGAKREENHIFNMFALVNFLLCSAVAGNHRDRSSDEMLQQCAKHYIETIKILRPTIVILQGKDKFGRILKATGTREYWHPLDEQFGRFESPELSFLTCQFYHPAQPQHFWGDKPNRLYFRDVVLPTLKRALNEMGVERV